MFLVLDSTGHEVGMTADLDLALTASDTVKGTIAEAVQPDWCEAHNEAFCRCPHSLYVSPPPVLGHGKTRRVAA